MARTPTARTTGTATRRRPTHPGPAHLTQATSSPGPWTSGKNRSTARVSLGSSQPGSPGGAVAPLRSQRPVVPNERKSPVEVKIGVQNVARELSIETDQTMEEVGAAVRKALADPQGMLTLTDNKGREI